YGVGTVSGALIGLRWRPGRPLVIALAGLLLTPVLYVCFALAAPLVIVILGAVAAGAAVAVFDILWETAVAERVPPHVLSRVSSFDWMGSLALTPIGYLLAGTLASQVHAQTLMLWSAALTSILVLFALAQRDTREMRRIEYAAAQRP